MATTLKRITKKARRSNAKFKRMTPAQKRVAIAADVINSLELKRYRAKVGKYLQGRIDKLVAKKESTDVERELCKLPSCQVCAIGGLFVSSVRQFDSLNVGSGCGQVFSLSDGDSLRTHLKRFFSSYQLDAIEGAFEGWRHWEFFDRFQQTSERMTAIMQNIIKNNGTFRP